MSLWNAAALIVIDVQQGLDDPRYGTRNHPQAEANIAALLNLWRQRGWTVAHVQHASDEPTSPLRKSAPGFAFKPESEPQPGEPVFEKNVNSAFIGTPLAPWLREQEHRRLVLVGLTTDHCVSTSVRTGANIGFDILLVNDATATHERKTFDGETMTADQMHRTAVASLNHEFCAVMNTGELLESFKAP